MRVSERLKLLKHPAALGLSRRFTVNVSSGLTGWFLAGESSIPPRVFEGGRIQSLTNAAADLPGAGRLLLLKQPDGRLAGLELEGNAASWRIESHGGGWQALVKLPPAATDAARQVVVRVWAIPGEELDLLRSLMAGK